MRSAQILAVDLPDAVDLAELLLAGREVAVHAVDDLDEAAELAGVVGADLVFLSPAAAGDDPIARIAQFGEAFGDRPPPVAAIYPEAFQCTRVYVRPEGAAEWVVASPGGERLAAFLASLIDRGCGIVHVELPQKGGLKSRLIDVGFNSLVKAAAGDVSVQTETHVLGAKTVIRSTAFFSGRIALSRRFPVGFAANPLEETRRLAEEIHRETCERAARLDGGRG
jgi:hypothetical protein